MVEIYRVPLDKSFIKHEFIVTNSKTNRKYVLNIKTGKINMISKSLYDLIPGVAITNSDFIKLLDNLELTNTNSKIIKMIKDKEKEY